MKPAARRKPSFLGVLHRLTVFGLFLAALLETGNRLALFPGPAIWLLAAGAAAAGALPFSRRTAAGPSERRIALALAGAALVAFGCRLSLGLEAASGPESAARAADRVDAWFAEVTRQIGDSAYLLARTPHIAAAVEGSDARDYRARAFAVLSEWPLATGIDPAGGIGRAGATLYDRNLRPIAWSGGNPDLEGTLAGFFPEGVRAEDCPDPAFPLFLYTERGRRGYLAAAECTRNLLGLVTVELLLLESPPPSSGAPAVSALETAARRGLEIQFLRGTEDPEGLAQLFERRGERFVEGSAEARRYFFALDAYDGQLLGAASTAVAPAAARRAEQRAEARWVAALALLIGGGAAAPALWKTGFAGALLALWTTRLGLAALAQALPAGFAPSLLLPSGAPRIVPFPGISLPGLPLPDLYLLDDSPLGAMLTAAALFLTVRLFQQWHGGKRRGGRPASILRGAVAGAAAVWGAALVRAAGSGALVLAPTWRVGIGWPEVLGWTALLLALSGAVLLVATLLAPRAPVAWPVVLSAFAVVLGAALFTEDDSLGFAALPLVVVLVGLGRRGRLALRRLRRPLLREEPGFAFVIAFALLALPPLLWYPAMHWSEEAALDRYAADAAPVQIRRHRLAVCHALGEAARALDTQPSNLEPLRPETAYRLWLATGLARLTAASALEVRGPGGGVSRFGVGLSRRPDPPPSDLAGLDWSPIPDCQRDGPFREDTILSTQRRFASGSRVTLRAAVRTREIPFLPQPPGIADHFLSRGDAAPVVFQGRDLRLARGASGEPAPGRISAEVTVAGEPFLVSWRATRAADIAARLLGWVFLAALVALLVALAARLRLLVPGPGGRVRRRSFQMQLTETLATAVLVAIFGLVLFTQQRLSGLLEAASDREALDRSRAVQRVAGELGGLDFAATPEELASRLAHAADQLDTDAALYAGGGLIAVSRPELVQTGLLPPRPPPVAVGGRPPRAPVFSFQEAKPLRYRILWTPLGRSLPSGGALLLAVPLPADEAERIESVRTLQRALFFGSGSVALVFAILLPGFLARRLAAPVRSLARATGRIADGELATPVPVPGALAELRLLAASVERLVRRVPSVRRRMREEAAADLTRRVAHDIKNALAPIGLAADYIRKVQRDPRGRDPAAAVEEGVTEILGQVERLRRISSEFSALGAPLRIETVDPAKLVRDTVAPYLRAATGPQVSFSAVGSRPIQADAELVARIVENLLQNALEAAFDAPRDDGAEGAIAVRMIGADGSPWIRIEVEDDGPGVSPELRERIFDAAFSTRTRGSGLGLANARRFAEAHRGRLIAGPRPDGGRGLLLTLQLPVTGSRAPGS